jgi:anti-sigma factor RsiW
MTGARRFTVSTPDWGQAHLSLDAIVAYVDDELAPGARTRAESHLSCCGGCRAEVVAQRQARTALRAADGPQLPSSLLHSLRAIPVDTELPPMPPGLAVTAEGEFVLLRDVPPAGLAPDAHPAPRRFSRRARFGAVSGLALGALAVGALVAPGSAPPPERGDLGGAVLDVPVQAKLSSSPAGPVGAIPAAATSPAPVAADATDATGATGSADATGSGGPADTPVLDAALREHLDRLPAAFPPGLP